LNFLFLISVCVITCCQQIYSPSFQMKPAGLISECWCVDR
jgi:hypothetical protein